MRYSCVLNAYNMCTVNAYKMHTKCIPMHTIRETYQFTFILHICYIFGAGAKGEGGGGGSHLFIGLYAFPKNLQISKVPYQNDITTNAYSYSIKASSVDSRKVVFIRYGS